MTNKGLAKAFAAGATKGRNSNGTMFIDGDTIYSYGYHFPIATRCGKVAFATTVRYSQTTSCHTGLVKGALHRAGFALVPVVNPVALSADQRGVAALILRQFREPAVRRRVAGGAADTLELTEGNFDRYAFLEACGI